MAAKKTAKKSAGKAPSHPAADEHLRRVRRICLALPSTIEKLSHGEPTFFVANKVYAMFDNNHHNCGHVAVWIPARRAGYADQDRTAEVLSAALCGRQGMGGCGSGGRRR